MRKTIIAGIFRLLVTCSCTLVHPLSFAAITQTKGGPAITSVVNHSLNEGTKARKFYGGITDDLKNIWFLTDAGLLTGSFLQVHAQNSNLPLKINHLAPDRMPEGSALWFSTTQGAVLATLPIEVNSNLTVYDMTSSGILSNHVYGVAIGKNSVRWFATDKGISSLYQGKWLPLNYKIHYPERMFRGLNITSLATSTDGDSLYVGTEGAGILRVYRDKVDAVSGASQYAQWGPLEMPSDSVYGICITPDGTQWIATSQGVGVHKGYVTLENWTVYNTGNGLVNNFVQCIASDAAGNIWCGTRGGLSVFDGSAWTSFTTKNGLLSNNILFIMSDSNGDIYIGSDNGLMVYRKGKLDCYQ